MRSPRARRRFKRRLLDFLWDQAPSLAASRNALRVNWERKVKRIAQAPDRAPAALLDGRTLKRGQPRAPAIPQTDLDILTGYTVKNCGGRVAQACRELARQGENSGLTPATQALLNAPHAHKSHVNRRLYTLVRRDAKLVRPYLLGKKAIDDATPSLRRDYRRLYSMQMVTADDFTMPVYSFVPDGRGWYSLTRGQVLLMVDCRSLKIIGWSLQPERNYNALVIRTLMNRTCAQWGLPRVWYFENGIWRRARLVTGQPLPREWRPGKSWAALKTGWAGLGVRFVHARRARAKPAELVGGKLQNLMERIPGYCGRDERRDCPAETRDNKLAVEAGRLEPHGRFLSFDAWEAELGRLIAAYNADPQQGGILQGQSPDQAFEAHWPHHDPPARMDANCWHLFAHYVSERTVGVEGIQFRLGRERYVYRDANTAPLRGQSVLAWFDPECPEWLGVTDLNQRQPVLVPRAHPVDCLAALDPDGPAGQRYQAELGKAAAHNAYPKARFHAVMASFTPSFRRNVVAPKVADTAQSFTAQRRDRQAQTKQAARRRATAAARAARLRLPRELVANPDAHTEEGLKLMERAMRETAPPKGANP